jgi:hypothetical protein
MRTLAPAFALALLCACSGYTSGDSSGGGGGVGNADSGQPDGGDGGADAGDAGSDAGTDGGCVALTLNGVGAIDGCHASASTSATGTVNLANCTIDIVIPTFLGPCSGTVSGPSDAFDGGCAGGSFTCTSPSLPGDMTCTAAGPIICVVRICDAGTCP